MDTQPTVKTINTNGQICLGHEFAGQEVFIDTPEAGVWIIRSTNIIPQNESWIHEPKEQKNLEDAMSWAVTHGVSSENTAEILNKLKNEIENA